LITGETTSGVEDQVISSLQVIIFPNPCSESFLIQSESELQKVEVYSITGSKVFERNLHEKSLMIDMTGFTPGRYIVVTHLINREKAVVSTVVRN
jgi:hypothetical protein